MNEILQNIPNEWKNADYEIQLVCEEFSSLCPMSGLPDIGKIHIKYTPKNHLIEMKSLKAYLTTFRNEAIFLEFLVNKICHDLAQFIHPKKLEVRGEFSPRGGIKIMPVARFESTLE